MFSIADVKNMIILLITNTFFFFKFEHYLKQLCFCNWNCNIMLHQLVCTCMSFTAISVSSPYCANVWAFYSNYILLFQGKHKGMFILYREGYGTVHPFSLCALEHLRVACLKKKCVKVSLSSLCGLHWYVAKFWYSGYMCHNMRKAGKSVCSGGKLWLMAGILQLPLPCEVQYTSQNNSIICLLQSVKHSAYEADHSPPFSADAKNVQSCKSMLLYKALGNVTFFVNTHFSYRGDIQF